MYSDCCFAVKKILWAKATINLESFWSGFVFIESCYFYCCHYRRCAITHHNLAASAAVIDGEGRIVWANFGQLTKVDTAREMWIITQQHIARTQKFQVSYFCSCKSNIFFTTLTISQANDSSVWKDESERRNIFVPSVGDQCIGQCLWRRNCVQRRASGQLQSPNSSKFFPIATISWFMKDDFVRSWSDKWGQVFQDKSHFTMGHWLRTVGGEVSCETINCRQVFQRKKPLIKEERLNLFRISAPVWIFRQENKSSNQVLYLSHYDDKLGKRLMFRMHFIMSQLVQRSKHKGSNFATLQHKFQTDADVFQGWHCQDVGC